MPIEGSLEETLLLFPKNLLALFEEEIGGHLPSLPGIPKQPFQEREEGLLAELGLSLQEEENRLITAVDGSVR